MNSILWIAVRMRWNTWSLNSADSSMKHIIVMSLEWLILKDIYQLIFSPSTFEFFDGRLECLSFVDPKFWGDPLSPLNSRSHLFYLNAIQKYEYINSHHWITEWKPSKTVFEYRFHPNRSVCIGIRIRRILFLQVLISYTLI